MPESQALLVQSPHAESAVVFVHGWGGSAARTWEEFPWCVASMREAASSDAYFLDYPSILPQVPFCAARFRKFLFDLVHDPIGRVVNPSLPSGAPRRTTGGRYGRIVLVAHSMGPVVVRRALLDLERADPDRLTDGELGGIRLLFFAPAHSGSRIPLLIGAGLGLDMLPGAALIGSLLKLTIQSLRDFEEGSPALQKLADDCRESRTLREERGAATRHLRACVYHAQNDRVVAQSDFDDDFPFETVMHKNQSTVCKPEGRYTTPMEALRSVLSA
jgi:hypothetical protein